MCECVKKNYDVVKRVALKFVKVINEDVHIYKLNLNGTVIYDFEPASIDREDVVEVLTYENTD